MHNDRIREIWEGDAVPQPAEFETLDQRQFEAINGDLGGAWAPSSLVTIGGNGLQARLITGVFEAPDTPGTNDLFVGVDNGTVYVPATLTAARTYKLSATGAVRGDVVSVFVDPMCNYEVALLDQGGVELTVLERDKPYASFVYLEGWRILNQSRFCDFRADSLHHGQTWVCPRGVTVVLLRGFGGGGGGGGGTTGTSVAGQCTRGGSGGGGALPTYVTAGVTPGVSYSIIGGFGGIGGNPDENGNPGASIRFESVPDVDTVLFHPGGAGLAFTGLADNDPVTRGGGLGGYGLSYAVPIGSVSLAPGDGGYGGTRGDGGPGAAMDGGDPGTPGSAPFVSGEAYVAGGGGGAGGGGPRGNGGNGGNGGAGSLAGVGGAGTAGTLGAPFTGAGGGGGGGGGGGSAGGGAGGGGGNGGSGSVTIIYVR